jgi:hypothetical protein
MNARMGIPTISGDKSYPTCLERRAMKFPFYFIAMKIIEGVFLFGLIMLGAWKLLELVGR